jgi:uncharacterized protein (TIGR03083 family)
MVAANALRRLEPNVDTDASHWITALGTSHERVRGLVEPLDSDEVRASAYPSEWSIAQVLSHLGSGAEIFNLFLDAALSGEDPPGRELFEPIWAEWNSRSPETQVSEAIRVDAVFVERISALSPTQRDELHLSMFGMEVDVVGLARMRLGEHAVHTWDVAVARDDSATVAADAVALLVDALGQVAARAGKPAGEPQRILVRTTGPDRRLVLDIGESVSLTEAGDDDDLPTLRIPAEALVRLVYGRLDPVHTPPIETGDVDLDLLRRVFPGF